MIGDLVVGGPGNHDAARACQRLQAVSDVHAVAVDVVAFDDHVAEINGDAELQPLVGRGAGVQLGLRPLDVDCASQGVDDALELHQDAVAHRLDEATVMRSDPGFKNILEICLEAGACTLLVCLAQAAIADDIGNHHGG